MNIYTVWGAYTPPADMPANYACVMSRPSWFEKGQGSAKLWRFMRALDDVAQAAWIKGESLTAAPLTWAAFEQSEAA